MKFLIAGLGNIGNEYTNTRHNIGFKILDSIAKESNIFFSEEKQVLRSVYKFKSKKFILIKPTTFMNLSGKAINYWLQKEKIPKEKLLVITDDIALPFGKIRLRSKGSDGGHNGLNSIITSLQTNKFARLRFGIDKKFFPGQQSKYVLGNFTGEENKKLNERIFECISVVQNFGTIGLQRSMSLIKN